MRQVIHAIWRHASIIGTAALTLCTMLFTPPVLGAPLQWSYRIMNAFPHDPDAYTQGLLYHNGMLYESTGLYGHSQLRRVDPETGRVLDSYRLTDDLFGEGLARVDSRFFQLTWKHEQCIVYGVDDLEPSRRFEYEGEGWGLAHEGGRLYMSDGTNRITIRDPKTFDVIRTIYAHQGEQSINRLNELEVIGGQIWANVYGAGQIVIIDPSEGEVVAWIDLSAVARVHKRRGVLNGIAYDEERDLVYITGKRWPKLYSLRMLPLVSREPTPIGNN